MADNQFEEDESDQTVSIQEYLKDVEEQELVSFIQFFMFRVLLILCE